jgi:eukaryotic-like serine/threonine-protein kinase
VESDLGKNAESEAAFKKSIELAPTYAAYSNLGALYYSEKRYSDAAAATEKALALNDQDYRVWQNLDNAYTWLGDHAKAQAAADHELSLLEAQAKVRPRDARMQSALAVLYARKKLREKTLMHIQAALAMSPGESWILVDVAEAYEDLGDRRQAIAYAQDGLKRGYDLDDLKNIPGLVAALKDPNFQFPGKK